MAIVPKAKAPLKPKTRREHPCEPIWAALEKMGHQPLPSIAKHPPILRWPVVPTDAKARRDWPLRGRDKDTGEWRDVGVGIRMIDGLLVFDIDVEDDLWRDVVYVAIEEIAPGALAQMVKRHSGKASIALFARTDFRKKFATHGYAEQEGGERVARVELFAGGIPKHVATHGPHAKPGRFYDYVDRRLEDTPIADLPLIPEAQVWAILKRVEEKFDELLVRESEQREGGDNLKLVFDLEPGMTFTLEDGEDVELVELEDRLTGRGLSGFAHLWDRQSKRKDRCKAVQSRYGLMIIDWDTDIGHCWKDSEPPPLDDLPGRLRALKARQDSGVGGGSPPATPAPPASSSEGILPSMPPPAPPGGAGTATPVAEWLAQCFGWKPHKTGMVIRLYAADEESVELSIASFRETFASSFDLLPPGPRGGQKKAHAVDLWRLSPTRIEIAGVRLRPDQPFPVYVEDGGVWKNLYRAPEHRDPHKGGVVWFQAFMEHLIPDRTEREWFLDWLAHKLRFPHIPGVAVIMVADQVFGAGRGILFSILRLLFGPAYVGEQSFNVISGDSGQSQYTGWLAHRVLVVINEAQTSSTSYRRGERNAVYEALKDVVDPAPTPRTLKIKKGVDMVATVHASVIVASNHINAVAIPENDRRFTVLRNGARLAEEHAERLIQWRDDPANIAALAVWLARRDISKFTAFQPLRTEAKQEMAELAIPPIERALISIRDDEATPIAFTRMQLKQQVALHLFGPGRAIDGAGMGGLDDAIDRFTACPRDERRRPLHRVMSNGVRRDLICFHQRLKQLTEMPHAAARRQAERWGGLDASEKPEVVTPTPPTPPEEPPTENKA